MTNAPIFILNAPKRIGKDTVAHFMQTYCGELRKGSFKDPLFNILLATTGMNQAEFFDNYDKGDWKDTPKESLNNKSVRDLLIQISENYIKPFFGPDYFGQTLATIISGAEDEIGEEKPWVIPDGGFNAEVEALVKRFGDRVVVVQITREGYCDFGTDSRNWIELEGVTTLKVSNEGDNGSHRLAIELLRKYDLLDFEPIL